MLRDRVRSLVRGLHAKPVTNHELIAQAIAYLQGAGYLHAPPGRLLADQRPCNAQRAPGPRARRLPDPHRADDSWRTTMLIILIAFAASALIGALITALVFCNAPHPANAVTLET